MNLKEIRQLLRDGHSVVLLEDGERPLVVSELPQPQAHVEEVPIASRWPKSRPELSEPVPDDDRTRRQDHVLERLNKEILSLKAQIEQEDAVA